MHTVQLLLKTSKYERHEIDRRFHALAHLHNVCVKHARKCMIRLQHDKRYAELRQLYNELVKKEKMSKEEKSQKKKLAKQLAACRTEQGLSKASLEHYIKVCGKQFSKLLSSQQVQAEADRVWCGVERCLFGNGKELHFKKLMDFDTIGGKSNKNGARFDLDAMYVNWLGLSLKCYLPKSENSLSYVWESLKGKISYCNIKRLMFSSGWRYYAEIVVSGAAPTRVSIGTSTMGIDPGVSTIAGVSEDACVLEELAPNAIQYEKKIQKISQRMDRSRRISNPNKYNEDGTINRSNRDPWKYSKNYVKMCRLLKSLYRKKHAYIVDSHRKLCNKLITIAIAVCLKDVISSFLKILKHCCTCADTLHVDLFDVIRSVWNLSCLILEDSHVINCICRNQINHLECFRIHISGLLCNLNSSICFFYRSLGFWLYREITLAAAICYIRNSCQEWGNRSVLALTAVLYQQVHAPWKF